MSVLFFICQKGSLELKGRILAASLRHFCKEKAEIVACMPSQHAIGENTAGIFKKLNIEIFTFDPHLWPKFDYPIGNKVDAALALTKATGKRCIFFDTDMIA